MLIDVNAADHRNLPDVTLAFAPAAVVAAPATAYLKR